MNAENLSPQEKEVNRLINASKARIAAMEQEISGLQRDQGPAPRYKLPGGPEPHEPSRNAELKQELLQAIDKEKRDLAEQVDKTLMGADSGIREAGQRNLADFLYADGKMPEQSAEKALSPSQEFAMKLRYSREQGKIADHERAMEKDLDNSQDFADKLLQTEKEQVAAKEVKDTNLQKEEPQKEDQSPCMSMSAQFSQKLGYTQWEQRNGEERTQAPAKAKDDKEPDRD